MAATSSSTSLLSADFTDHGALKNDVKFRDWSADDDIGRRTHKTFKANTDRGSHRFKLMNETRNALVTSGDMQNAVKLPKGEDQNEWLAMHTLNFYNEISLLYEMVRSRDTPDRFPIMCAGKKFQYFWADETTTKPLKLPAGEYIGRLFKWVERLLNDEATFPTRRENYFPLDFRTTVSKIFRRLFRVYAHIYYDHFDVIVEADAQPHINSCLKHFALFVQEYKLVGEKDLEPLKQVIRHLVETDSLTTLDSTPTHRSKTSADLPRPVSPGTPGSAVGPPPPEPNNCPCSIL